jgi:glycosyltransferase involved in cell wall biosynthesis
MVPSFNTTNIIRKCLVISHGPVPTPEHPVVEGGGLRCWGVAKGVKSNNKNIEVTVAYHNSYVKADFTDSFENINIATWTNDTVADLIEGFDSIVVSYCMGDLSILVAANIKPDQQLVLDCYVPIYVEVSARESKDIEAEYHAFTSDVPRWGEVLKRGDIFLVASDTQKRYYQGVLSALGRINPVTYGKESIRVVPYGIYRDKPVAKEKPILKLVGEGDYKKVLWFGGIYPWFDLRVLVDAVSLVNEKSPTKLVIVGAKNPYNTHPDFVRRYEELVGYIESDQKFKDVVVMQEWIKFEDRADWYLDSDCVVVINKEGPENELAWRTRLVDFIWADLPIITNGGDPLGESLVAHEAAFKFGAMDKETIANDISKVLASTGLKQIRKNLAGMREAYYWDTVTAKLAEDIMEHTRAVDLEVFGMFSASNTQSRTTGRVRKVVRKARKVPAYANKYGYRATAGAVKELVKRKLVTNSVLSERKRPAYVFVSHQLDMSGAPFIVIDMALEFKDAGHNIEFYTYLPAHKDNLSKLNKAGIKPHVLMNRDMVPSFIPGDTMVLNTVAHSEVVKEAIFSAAEQGSIKQVLWYLHEDDPELIFRPDEQRRIKKMLQKNQMKMLIAAKKMRANYIEYFETEKNIKLLSYRHIVPHKYHRKLKSDDFTKKLTFVLPGTVGDGRKGQLPIFYAFIQFYREFYKQNKDAYRDFELIFIGISTDFLSRQIVGHADALKGHFSYHGKVTWTEDLDIVQTGNMTICYSIRECLPLFVFEGMVSGHPLLRNDSSGIDEQLEVGKNGYYLETENYDQVVTTLETVLNKSKTSDETLAKMSKRSYEIASKQADNSYLDCLE